MTFSPMWLNVIGVLYSTLAAVMFAGLALGLWQKWCSR